MKNVALLALALSVLGNVANAESAVNEAPTLKTEQAASWVKSASAYNTQAIESRLEKKLNKAIEQASVDLDKRLELKMTKEMEYALH